MKATAKTAFIHAFIIALFTAATTWAADTPKPDPKDPDKKDLQMEQARDAIAKQDWVGAQALLRVAVERNPQSADAHNLYAYSMRKGPNPAMDLVFRHYNEALRINPRHLGAHEYIGEAYLMSGNVPKAREHLAQLEKLCGADCREYQLLKVAVAAQEQQHAQK
ncbi:MAG TPA: tetratricopeptide repeat protein [Burkholderiales bacterium]|nr:tetratricopeptide repeat protein [Burkholderiales bacterium]